MVVDGCAPSYFHYYSIVIVIGLTGSTKLTDSYFYDAFGNVRARSGTCTQPPLGVDYPKRRGGSQRPRSAYCP
jgi:hypothetical protein